MCGESSHVAGKRPARDDADEWPADWETMPLPPDHILKHLTDAHCHPTDLDHMPEVYDQVALGGIAAMATVPEDQDKVDALAAERPWCPTYGPSKGRPKDAGREGRSGPLVVACFGYHPWFTHRYTLAEPPPAKETHYASLFFPSTTSTTPSIPSTKKGELLRTLLPYLPDPLPFATLRDKLREDIRRNVQSGRLTMLGEVGLDGGARMRWPPSARHLYVEKHPRTPAAGDRKESSEGESRAMGEEGEGRAGEGEEEEEWRRVTPFKVSMKHQKAIVEAQMEVAIELGVNVSFHSVAAPGPTMEVLTILRDKHRTKFTNRINVDLHSAGGWSPEFWTQAEKNLRNLYASPSILITSRTLSAPALIRAISPDRLLVESDSHDVRLSGRLVWAATEWVARCKGWKLEGGDTDDWQEGDEEDEDGDEGKAQRGGKGETWAVRTLERNWRRFMRLAAE